MNLKINDFAFYSKLFVLIILLFCWQIDGFAQTNEFTYQGKLNDGAAAANGSYDFQFELHDSLSSTTPLASATRLGVSVSNGIFTVKLDFPAALFNGTDRFLKISVKPAGNPNPFTPLSPYQPITSAPYAIKSKYSENALIAENANLAANADRLGGITADQYVLTTDTRMSDARTPLPGSPNYVQNSTVQQTSSNFNISGTGTANIFNASQYNIGGNRAFVALGGGTLSVFAGLGAGTSNTSGFGNTFVGNFAGNVNSIGSNNTFIGSDAGRNTNGNGNSFFGRSAGYDTTSGNDNAFFGLDAGRFNISGSNNAFFGKDSGFNNTADNNSFFGYRAGFTNTSGNSNAFFGFNAGRANQTGNFNSFFGNQAGTVSTGNSNSFFGSSTGIVNTTGGNNSFFGAVAGFSNTVGSFNTFYGNGAGLANTVGSNNTAIGYLANFGSNNLNYATAIGSGSIVSTSNTIALGRSDGSDSVLIYGNLVLNGNLAVSGTLDFPAGDTDYIQNRTTQQTSSNFNISGTGTANIFNATQYNIGGTRAFIALGGGTLSVFAGLNAGTSNTSGFGNTFVGSFAGNTNSTGSNNTFVGSDAGRNTNGGGNSFFGRSAGYDTTSGTDNSFFGLDAGRFNQTGSQNAFFGKEAGFSNTATGNAFFGFQSGRANTTGAGNTFVGWQAGAGNTSGTGNIFIGNNSGNGSPGTGSFNVIVGNNSYVGTNTSGAIVIGNLATNNDSNTMLLSSSVINVAGFTNFKEEVIFEKYVRLYQLISSGSQAVCLNSFSFFAACSSSLRYKNNVQTFNGGLDLLRRFRPVTFNWKEDNKADIGFIAEEVNEIEPLLVTRNKDGEIEGVKYAQITTVLVNAVKEQQAQIETQRQLIEQQQRQIEALKKVVCAQNPTAEICREQ